MRPRTDKLRLVSGLALLLVLCSTLATSRTVEQQTRGSTDDADLRAVRDLIVHDVGNVRMTLANWGETGNPDGTPGFRGFEFPLGSGNDFLFSAGVWIGAEVDGERRVSTATDGDNGTGEFWPIHIGTVPLSRSVGTDKDEDWYITSKSFSTFNGKEYQFGAKEIDDDHDWPGGDADYDRNGLPSANYDLGSGLIGEDDDGDGLIDEDSVAFQNGIWIDVDADLDSNFSDTGISGDINGDGNASYDPEPGIDEDPAGDISSDYIDNDFDGLVDLADPDLDGDVFAGSLDDDGDGEFDEDGVARGAQEYFTVFQDSISQSYVQSPNGEHVPLQIQVLQRTYAFPEAYASGFILLDYRIRNVSPRTLRRMYIAMFSDPDILASGEGGDAGSLDDGNRYDPERTMMIHYDDTTDADGNGPGIFAIRVVKTPVPLNQLRVTFANFERNAGGDPTLDNDKYELMSSGDIAEEASPLGDWRMLISFGDILNDGFELGPGEELPITVAFIAGTSIAEGRENARVARTMYLNDFKGPSAPDSPDFDVEVLDNYRVRIRWRANSEASVDAFSKAQDWEGYIIERSTDQTVWEQVAGYDKIDTLSGEFEWQNYNLGMPDACPDFPEEYCFVDDGLIPGHRYYYVVRAFDQGYPGAGVLYSGRSGNSIQALMALSDSTGATENLDGVYVFPNPYKGSHDGERLGLPNPAAPDITFYPRQLYFKGLPANSTPGACIIRIFSLGGDHLATIDHHNGTDFDQWDLLTGSRQEIVSGIYYYTVEYNKPSGGTEHKMDKFVVLK